MWRPRWLRRSAMLIAALLILEYGLLPQVAGARQTLHLLAAARAPYLVVAVALEAASLLAWSLLTRVVLPPAGAPPMRTLIRIDLTTLGVNHVVPGGGATGNALRYRLLTASGVRAADAVFGAVVQSTGSAIVLNALLWIALLPAVARYGLTPFSGVAAALGAVLFVAATLVVLALRPGSTRTVRLARAVFARLPGVSADAVERQVRRVVQHLAEFGRNRRLLARAIGWAALNWLLDAASLGFFMASFGHFPDVDGLLIAYGLANVLAVLPFTPGGLGVVEAVLVPTLVAAGSPRGIAILGVLSWRLVNFWLPIPVSVLAYLSLRTGALRAHSLPARWPWRTGHPQR